MAYCNEIISPPMAKGMPAKISTFIYFFSQQQGQNEILKELYHKNLCDFPNFAQLLSQFLIRISKNLSIVFTLIEIFQCLKKNHVYFS